ncbi:hypothetical protein [Catenuloplanes indicus]|uniref:Uncharacterized protein n=1 Tax=Catenuloplanes indicus TaxID=137267 RepID=A0AAE4B0F3_9ACTN|nr:hypothetical protein [Catenuloplanes indicus]MDQ0368611.1 hypothetical protein [Catenuloplanes indicus]
MEIYTMLQIPSMSPALLLSVAGPVRSSSVATHVSPWQVRSIMSDVPQVDQVRTLAELRVQDGLQQAYGEIELQGTGVSPVSGNESLKGRSGSTGSNGITGNKGMSKRAFGGARGVPPRGRPV